MSQDREAREGKEDRRDVFASVFEDQFRSTGLPRETSALWRSRIRLMTYMLGEKGGNAEAGRSALATRR